MLSLHSVTKLYRAGDVETRALDDVSLDIADGEFVAIMGPSGCGKSTLLNLVGLLDSPTSGDLTFFGENVGGSPEKFLTLLRRERLGFIFQNFNLIDDLTVEENVQIGLAYRNIEGGKRRTVGEALERCGIAHRAKHFPKQLSGGQQQRVAIARALVSEPSLILADEPTGNLDTANGEMVMGLLQEANKAGVGIVMVTHSPEHAAVAARTINLLDGRIISETGTRVQ